MFDFAYRYAVIPPAHPDVTALYLRQQAHLERIAFEGQEAWLVDRSIRRKVERRWSRLYYGIPTPEGAAQLAALAAARLRKTDDLDKWAIRYWRHELAVLRTIVIIWWAHYCPSHVERVFVSPDPWIGEAALTEDEMRLSTPDVDGNFPVIRILGHTATTFTLQPEWDGMELAQQQPRILPAGTHMKLVDLCQQMWRFLPDAPVYKMTDTPQQEAERWPTSVAWSGSPAWPEPGLVVRVDDYLRPDGGQKERPRRRPKWLRPLRHSRDLAAVERKAIVDV